MINELKKRANAGDSRAMLELALAYSKENSVYNIVENPKAISWYQDEFKNLTGTESRLEREELATPNIPEAIKWYEEAYRHGEPIAYSYLGSLYELGKGVEVDYERAEYYFKEATKSGDPFTYLALGSFYENSQEDLFSAIEAYRETVNRGNVYDAESLGRAYFKAAMYMQEQNPEQAQELFDRGLVAYRKAAEANNLEAMFWVGEAYRQGMGVEQDTEQALEWFARASELGHPVAMISQGTYLATEEATQEELNEARTHFQNAADAGDAMGLYCLGEWYSLNNNEEYNLNTAVDYMTQAIEHSDQDYFPYLARINTVAPLISKKEAEKIYSERGQIDIESPSFYEERSKQGDKVAMFRLAEAYRYGNGVEQDSEQAIHWYEEAGKLGNIGVGLPLATFYYEGEFLDYEKAIGYLNYAAQYNDSASMYNLGIIYHSTEDFEDHNLETAIYWYMRASELGHVNAKFQIGNIYLSEFSEQEEEYYDLGMAWMYDAAGFGHKDALFIVGVEMAYGETFGHNPELAIEMLQLASEQGDTEADSHIEKIREDFNL